MRPSERRYYTTEFEARAVGDGFQIAGHAAVFDRLSKDLGGFVERVAHGAFKRSINSGADVRALFNHDPSLILGRSVSGTLKIGEDNIGLAYEINLGNQSYARDLYESIQRGDITQSSFGFFNSHDAWSRTDAGYPLRTLIENEINDGDVSPVTYPAYPDADSGVRAVRARADKLGMSAAVLLENIRAGRLPDEADPDIETRDDENPKPEPAPPAASDATNRLRALQLDLLARRTPKQ